MLVKTGKKFAVYVEEPRIKLGSAYQAPVRAVPHDQEWLQQVLLTEGDIWMDKDKIVFCICVIGFALVMLFGWGM